MIPDASESDDLYQSCSDVCGTRSFGGDRICGDLTFTADSVLGSSKALQKEGKDINGWKKR
jgi:hypothetical protein